MKYSNLVFLDTYKASPFWISALGFQCRLTYENEDNISSLQSKETSQNPWDAHSTPVFNITAAEANTEEK